MVTSLREQLQEYNYTRAYHWEKILLQLIPRQADRWQLEKAN